jgi:hypothetical protein
VQVLKPIGFLICLLNCCACRISTDHHCDKHLKESSIVAGRVVDKEVHDRVCSEYAGNKLYRRDSSRARDRSSSPGYSDTLSEESKGDVYFKRANRHSDLTDFYEHTKHKNEHVKSDLYCNSSELGDGNSKKDYLGRSYTPSPVDDRYQQSDKLLWREEDPFAGQGRSSELLINCKSGRCLPKSGHKTRRDQESQRLAPGRCAVFDGRDKSTDNYPRRCARKYKQKISNSTSHRNKYQNAVHDELYGKQDYPCLKRVALRNDEHYLNAGSNDHHGRSSWHKFGEDVMEGFTSAKEWRRHFDDGYDSVLEAEVSNVNDGRMYRERYYEEMRTARQGCDGDDKFLYCTDYRFRRSESPNVRARYSNRGICAKSIDEHLKSLDHLASYPQENLNNSQRGCPAAGMTSMSSRNRCIGSKRIHNAKMMRYHYDGYHQKKHHDSSFRADSIPQSALYTDAVAETGRILPVKRKLHADLGSMNHKDIADLSLPKGRKVMHDQSVVSDRKIYDVWLHNSSKEFYREATFCSNEMTKISTVSNIGIEARHELGKGNKVLLNDRKTKVNFKEIINKVVHIRKFFRNIPFYFVPQILLCGMMNQEQPAHITQRSGRRGRGEERERGRER